jgi:hypothetical protein
MTIKPPRLQDILPLIADTDIAACDACLATLPPADEARQKARRPRRAKVTQQTTAADTNVKS